MYQCYTRSLVEAAEIPPGRRGDCGGGACGADGGRGVADHMRRMVGPVRRRRWLVDSSTWAMLL